MHRRRFSTALLFMLGATPLVVLAQGEEAGSATGIPVPESLLQQSLRQRFPLRYPVPGLLNLDVQVPRLRLLPEQNRLGAQMQVLAAGPALNRSHEGSFEVDFALRYEASDRTVRAHRLRMNRLRFPTLQPGVVDLLNTYAPALAEQSLLEVVLHQLSPKDLALADAVGMQPSSITVTESGLRIGLALKPL
ncbi:MAG: DUF1439 domain-containing protein [Hydrogenophaga sp.]|jgi:hypothetical protein|nr:DUF1439 domain-containing protein [Hydrogenophaga sp.]